MSWTLDEYKTSEQRQRVFVAEIGDYALRASECLHEGETPHYIIHLECGMRPAMNDRINADVCEIVAGFDSLDAGAELAISRWERYEKALRDSARES